MNQEKIKIAISHCLLGKNVRYDGMHKFDRYLVKTCGEFFDWVPFCPEAESGMGIPRERMRLEGSFESPRLIARPSRTDKTEQLLNWSVPKSIAMKNDELCGIILKKGSPSCGLFNIRPFDNDKNMPGKDSGAGLFAREVVKQMPNLPMEEEGRLNDANLREIFFEKVFVYHRWKKMMSSSESIKDLMHFHEIHKYQLMTRSQQRMTLLGQLVATSAKHDYQECKALYFNEMMTIMNTKPTTKKNRNTMTHLLGYFKKDISSDEKSEALDVIHQYSNKIVPLIVPITLLNHYARKYQQKYLLKQTYLEPSPKELLIRNSV